MNKWKIPKDIELAVIKRDTSCVYCGMPFNGENRKSKASWEHIINDAKIVTLENICRCCVSCNASKGALELDKWLLSRYCIRKGITKDSIADTPKNYLKKWQLTNA